VDARLIVALDTSHRRRALDLVECLLPAVRIFKVGLQLYSAHGPSIVREIAAAGGSVFLDLKLHDIPNTVAGAVSSACNLPGVVLMTLHVSGGRGMLTAAVKAARSCRQFAFEAVIPGSQRAALLGVTVLTSLDENDLAGIGVAGTPASQVERLAGLARESGLDGLVCSPQEVESLRETMGPDLLLVTPGIRPAGAAADDQKRIATPAQALRGGASHIVVGRPVTGADSPLDAARRILDSAEGARSRARVFGGAAAGAPSESCTSPSSRLPGWNLRGPDCGATGRPFPSRPPPPWSAWARA
jgi:orotidine-5'-phosphate decarboxylase